jgi:hypothetical protein
MPGRGQHYRPDDAQLFAKLTRSLVQLRVNTFIVAESAVGIEIADTLAAQLDTEGQRVRRIDASGVTSAFALLAQAGEPDSTDIATDDWLELIWRLADTSHRHDQPRFIIVDASRIQGSHSSCSGGCATACGRSTTDGPPSSHPASSATGHAEECTSEASADACQTNDLDLVLERAATINELATAVDQPPSTVAYHVGVLVKTGLFKIVRTRKVRAIDERFYGRTALSETLHDAIAAGELAPDLEVGATADTLLALYEGIQVLQRSTVGAIKVDAIVDVALNRLLPHYRP